jgi:hypothetical protein
MNRWMAAIFTTALASGPAAAAPTAQAPDGGELSVTVTYSGKGDVKKGNEIGVFLWTTPDIGQSPPFAVQVIEKNGGTAVFKNLTAPVVYIGVSYDDKGQYEETAGPPPTGTPVAVYTDKKSQAPTQGPPAPSPVKPGKGVKVHVKFDDSSRM